MAEEHGTTRVAAERGIAGFGRMLADDVRHGHFGSHLSRDLHDLYHFYLDEESRRRLGRMGRLKRWLSVAWWLLKNLILKLSPARRLMVLFSLWLILAGDISVGPASSGLNLDLHFGKFGYVILLVVLMLELKDKLLARDELAVGRAVQLALMPCESPDIPGWDVWLYSRPANDVGGDLVDFMPLGEGGLGLALGDVSGKGLGAALLMAKLQATLRAYANEFTVEGGLAEVGRRVNKLLCRDGLANRFATLVVLRILPGDGHVRLLNAGHMPPLLIRTGATETLPPVAPLLGILPAAVYKEQEVVLDEGDLLLAYSDGVTEAMNKAGEFFGEERLFSFTSQLRGLGSKEAGLLILSTVDAFLKGERPGDDLSLIILRRAQGGLSDDACGPALHNPLDKTPAEPGQEPS